MGIVATSFSNVSTSRWQVGPLIFLPLIIIPVVIAKVHPMVVTRSWTAGIAGGRRNNINNIVKPCGEGGCQQLNVAVEPQQEEDAAMTMVGAVMNDDDRTNAEEEVEMTMESETSRRLLGMHRKNYISYEVLRAEVVPCTKPGVPYYNCHAPPRFNAYHRACGIITRCARYDYP